MRIHLINLGKGDALTCCGETEAIPRELTTDPDKRTCGGCREGLIRNRMCPACLGKSLTWGTHPHKKTPVADGRLTANDVETIFYLGCDSCSETVIPMVDPETVAAALNAMEWIPS